MLQLITPDVKELHCPLTASLLEQLGKHYPRRLRRLMLFAPHDDACTAASASNPEVVNVRALVERLAVNPLPRLKSLEMWGNDFTYAYYDTAY